MRNKSIFIDTNSDIRDVEIHIITNKMYIVDAYKNGLMTPTEFSAILYYYKDLLSGSQYVTQEGAVIIASLQDLIEYNSPNVSIKKALRLSRKYKRWIDRGVRRSPLVRAFLMLSNKNKTIIDRVVFQVKNTIGKL